MLGIVFSCTDRQQLGPCIGQASECVDGGIEPDVNFVYKVGWDGYPRKGRAAVDVILPAVELFVAFERKVEALGCRFQDETVRLEICAFYRGDGL